MFGKSKFSKMSKLAVIIVILFCSSFVNAEQEGNCQVLLDKFKVETPLDLRSFKKYGNEKRLAYLRSIKSACDKSSEFIFYYYRELALHGLVDEAFLVVSSGISEKLVPIGNLHYMKADLMLNSLKAMYRKYELVDIYNEFRLAELQDNTVQTLIYLGYAELAVLNREYDNALKFIGIGSSRDESLSRFWTLTAIVMAKKGEFKSAVMYVQKAVEQWGDKYLAEDDTVLALVVSLCQIDQQKVALDILKKLKSKYPQMSKTKNIKEATVIASSCISKE